MSDIIDSLTGNSMLHLKQDIAYLRQCLAECEDEEKKPFRIHSVVFRLWFENRSYTARLCPVH